jgi:hypothetical protein
MRSVAVGSLVALVALVALADGYKPSTGQLYSATPTSSSVGVGAGAWSDVSTVFVKAKGSKTLRTLQDRFADTVSVKDFGADSTGAADSSGAFNSALALGGHVRVPSGTYKLLSRINVSVSGTTLELAANVTLNYSGYTYPGSQVPFGNAIQVTANDCAVIGNGPSSLIQMVASDANGIGLLTAARFRVANLTLDGGKGTVPTPTLTDDTFQSGISIIGYAGGASTQTTATEGLIDRVTVRNWAQHGFNLYGSLVNGVTISNSIIQFSGNAAYVQSLGSGIAITRGIKNVSMVGNHIIGNKFYGVFISSAGQTSTGFSIVGNSITGNGGGILVAEQAQYGSTSTIGTSDVQIVGNTIANSSSSAAGYGIRIGTFDWDYGYLKNIVVSGNIIRDSQFQGVIIQSTTGTVNRVSNVAISGNIFAGSGGAGIGFGPNLDSTISESGDTLNETTPIINSSAGSVAQWPASTTSTSLPLYAQGTWVPIIAGTTATGTGSGYGPQAGTYQKIGKRVDFDLAVGWTSHTGTGTTRILGLPFAVANAEPYPVIFCEPYGLASVTAGAQIFYYPSPGLTEGAVMQSVNGSIGTLSVPASGAYAIRCTGSYRTAN